MHFALIYDIRQAGCRDWFLAPITGALMLHGIVAWIRGSFWKDAQGRRMAPAGFAVLFAVITVLAFGATWAQYWQLVRVLSDGRASVVAGRVSSFEPAATYKGLERFVVDDRAFSYDRVQTAQGFHTMKSDGSPITTGAYVRILYDGNHILRLELAADPAGTDIPHAAVRPSSWRSAG